MPPFGPPLSGLLSQQAPIVLTIVAPRGMLAVALWERAVIAVMAHAKPAEPPRWLSSATACEWDLAEADTEALWQALDALKLDSLCVMRTEPRRKRVLIADMDSTMVQGETLDELAAEAGIKDRIAAITARAMAGELDFAEALRERVGALAGLEDGAIARTLARTRPMPGGEILVRTMAAHGARCWLVSGGFTEFTSAFAQRLGFHRSQGNQLEVQDGRLTGRVLPPILDRDAKVFALHQARDEASASTVEVIAVGDGANDLAMLQEAGLGVAYKAKPAVRAAARAQVNHTDLRALLYFQGYRDDQMAAPAG